MRTERMWSPRKIWMNGMIRNSERLEAIDPSPDDLQNFGIDPSGPVPEVQHQVSVPETICPFNDSERQRFLDGLQEYRYSDSDYGLHQYCAAKQLLSEILQHQDTAAGSSN